MENTTRDFWKMVMDYKVPAIVMLCSMKENNTVGLVKCHESVDYSLSAGGVLLLLASV